jgi:hypothetical protein
VGVSEERAILFNILMQDETISDNKQHFYELMKTRSIRVEGNWIDAINKLYNVRDKLRPGIVDKFMNHIKTIPYTKERFSHSFKYLGKEHDSFYDGLIALLEIVPSIENVDIKDFSYEILRNLRRELTYVCLDFLNADLFVLDEFQRFKSLLDGEDVSEAGEIAKAILQNDDARVLLLSATPFKPYTRQLEQLNGENHHEELRKLVMFLGGSKGEQLWSDFRANQQAFFQLLRFPETVFDDLKHSQLIKQNLEDSFKQFLTRNERMAVAKDYSNMTLEKSANDICIKPEDVKNYIAIDQLVKRVEEQCKYSSHRFGSTMEFTKSAPFPLSFLQGYKLKEVLDTVKNKDEIKSEIHKSAIAWVDYDRINTYKALAPDGGTDFPNPKLRTLVEEAFKDNAELLLWIPPTKPYYKPLGVFNKVKDYSKIIVFSSWAMAPRAIASLISYEAERKTLGSDEIPDNREAADERSYFASPRKPAPLLVYRIKETEKKTSFMMSNFILTYPSLSFAELCVLNTIKNFKYSYREVLYNQEKIIVDVFLKMKIKEQFVDQSKGEDRSWYWLAAPLLDRIQGKVNMPLNRVLYLESGTSDAYNSHLENLENILGSVVSGNKKLGKFPGDLFLVLANIMISSPAITSLVSLKRNYGYSVDIMNEAFQIADAYLSMFNKPEAISVVRLAVSSGKEFWRKTLTYCGYGNILAMMDEYIYMLKSSKGLESISQVREAFQSVLSVRTSSINVDLIKDDKEYKSNKMRAHFAVSYGDQKMQTDAGSKRMVGVRDVFNSPFRPFVLASTSIGQEGLDFHFYCRKIFHWNLPYNAIDIEQREGRINRFKGLVIRSKLASIIKDNDIIDRLKKHETNIWEAIFEEAEVKYKQEDMSGIKPFWYLDDGKIKIERFVPIHSLSNDSVKYASLKSTLALYRMTFGQPRQEELVEALKSSSLSETELKRLRKILLVNLSPLNL